MDDFNTLSNRLLNRCPAAGIILTRQFVNDAWQTMQGRREWSFRRRSGTFAPPTVYVQGSVSISAGTLLNPGNPFLVTGLNTVWTPDMAGRQIRAGGLLYPYFTITQVLSPTQLLIDQPWVGPDLINAPYQLLQCYYPVPTDFNYFYSVVSIKDGFRLWTNITEADLNMMDPQRTNTGQTYAVAYRDYTTQALGNVGPVVYIPVGGSPNDPAPVSSTSSGFAFPGPLTYLITITGGGTSGTATFTWQRVGTTTSNPGLSSEDPIDLEFGLQLSFPPSVTYVAGNYYTIQCTPGTGQSVPRYELWPAPTFNGYLYPYLYISKESSLTVDKPFLPPFIATRGEVLLEMALEKCAEFPGSDADHPNIYHDLKQAQYHRGKYLDMLIDLERNDEEVGVSLIDYQTYPYAPSPWFDGNWQQTHAPTFS